MGNRRRKRFGLVLLDTTSKKVLILRRINYALYNFINNNNENSSYENEHKDKLLTMYPGQFHESMYEFPKGVREKHESGFNCAVREFYEETGIKLNNVDKLNVLTEVFQYYTGKDNKNYLCIYYIMDIKLQNTNDCIIKFKNLPVLSDNLNVLICTFWYKVRKFFIKSNFNVLVLQLDSILYNRQVD